MAIESNVLGVICYRIGIRKCSELNYTVRRKLSQNYLRDNSAKCEAVFGNSFVVVVRNDLFTNVTPVPCDRPIVLRLVYVNDCVACGFYKGATSNHC